MELAKSPSLYKVKVTCSRRDSEYDDDFNLEAMMELATGLAPNLKEVIVLNLQPGGSLKPRRRRGSWQGLQCFTDGKLGSLTTLALKGVSGLRHATVLEDWARHVDFTCLQHLYLGGCYDAKTSGLSGETMDWVARNHSFPRVKTLGDYLSRNDMYQEKPQFSEQAVSFFQAFEGLEQLSIDGPIDSKILDAILSLHGPTLRQISLHPQEEYYSDIHSRDRREIPFEFTKDRVLHLAAQCPTLEELAIPIKRDKSSMSETELYRCFGRMRRLRSLFLILDCSNWRIARCNTYYPTFDEEDQRPLDDQSSSFLKKGELKETFINCAVDEALARSIWTVISQSKIGSRLERLKLWPTGGGEYGSLPRLPFTFTAMIQNMTRSWLSERIPRDDREEYTVRELGRDGRQARDEKEVDYLAYGHNPEIWEVFRSIWPSKEGSKDWRDDWSSSRLSVDSINGNESSRACP